LKYNIFEKENTIAWMALKATEVSAVRAAAMKSPTRYALRATIGLEGLKGDLTSRVTNVLHNDYTFLISETRIIITLRQYCDHGIRKMTQLGQQSREKFFRNIR
jgi:hypothetical protein